MNHKKLILFFAIFCQTFSAHAQHDGMNMSMNGFYGNYAGDREGSGTSWVPESSPMDGIHSMFGDWMTMVHGHADFVYDDQGGSRGDEKIFSESMFMGMATHPLGEGTIGFRSMLSLDPLMGRNGYPLLFQTGETADGVNPLVDRQHPHDLLMELAMTYSHPVADDSSVFFYFGYPGEPALGPPTFMHRFSGMYNPEAPIDHHWMDSTHVTFGVATIGYVWNNWKIDGSIFNGREPDQFRWNFDKIRFNSYSGRVTYNPTDRWSLQGSYGFLKSSEQLEPTVDQHRTTASAMYNLPFEKGNWQTTAVWGRDNNSPGNTLDAYLVESAIKLHDMHTFFGRAEYVEKDELFNVASPLAGNVFRVGKFSLGYICDLLLAKHLKVGMGGLGTVYTKPDSLDPYYGNHPMSWMIFTRITLI